MVKPGAVQFKLNLTNATGIAQEMFAFSKALLHESPDHQPPCPRGGCKSEHGASVSKLSVGAEKNKPAGVNLSCEL
jgi:hypothetical protein